MDNKQKLARLRQALYATGVAGAAAAVVFGYVDETEAAALLGIGGGLLGIAFYNVDTTPES